MTEEANHAGNSPMSLSGRQCCVFKRKLLPTLRVKQCQPQNSQPRVFASLSISVVKKMRWSVERTVFGTLVAELVKSIQEAPSQFCPYSQFHSFQSSTRPPCVGV